MKQRDPVEHEHPWKMVWGQPYIDAERFSSSIEAELLHNPEPDFRTRLLVRDACTALESYWGATSFKQWLHHNPARPIIEKILEENLGESGFHNIRRRLVTSINKKQLEQVFDLLGAKIQRPLEACIAGSIPTLVEGLTARPTDDIDFVDEIPQEIRDERSTIELIADKYGLTLGHVQSHYLPSNWQERRKYLGDFGKLRIYMVDEYDIFVSKLSSKKEKHLDDLRVLAEKLDMNKAKERLLTDGKAFLERPTDKQAIEDNWHFIYREKL